MWTSFLHREFGAAQGYASPNLFFYKLPNYTKFFVNHVFLALFRIWQGSIIFLAVNNFHKNNSPGSVVESGILRLAQYFPVSFLRIKGQILLTFSSSSFAHQCRLLSSVDFYSFSCHLFSRFFLLIKKDSKEDIFIETGRFRSWWHL